MAKEETGVPVKKGPRDRGMLFFVLKYGVFGWGVSAGVAYFLMELARRAPDLQTHALYAATIFPGIGLVAGLLIWFIGGKKKI